MDAHERWERDKEEKRMEVGKKEEVWSRDDGKHGRIKTNLPRMAEHGRTEHVIKTPGTKTPWVQTPWDRGRG